MRYKAVLFLLSRLLIIVGAFLLIPAMVSFYYHEKNVVVYFSTISASVIFIGGMLQIFFRQFQNETIGLRDGFLLVTLSWLILSLIGALPFFFSGFFPHFSDAFFESASGFTTTGASVLKDVEALPKGLLFWRSFTHWIGGMGIIVLAVAILPHLSVGGMQLMKSEMPGPTFEMLKPRIRQTAMSLWKVYLLFSVAQVICLCLLQMSFFDSICHMFATMGTGGFSTKNASVAAFASPAIDMVITLFMFLAGMNFVIHYYVLRGNFKKPFTDSEFQFYCGLITVSFFIITADLVIQHQEELLRSSQYAIFQILSIVSTTGFATADFDAWPQLSKGFLFLLMFVGGCAGSTGGGLKQVRLMLLFKKAKQAILQHIFPKAIVSVKLNKRPIPESILHGVSSFLLLYLVIFSFGTLILLAFNLDFVTATSAVVACLSNVGPGFGEVGPMLNYAFLPAALKYVLAVLMIIGRLEIFTVLVLFFPVTWKK
jgi:trk system potassium uptake protein TrkH